MPKAKDLHGQSELATEQKQVGLYYAFRLNYVVARKHADWMPPYQHVDLNAGSGYNDRASCVGSPITFLRVFNGHKPFCATFIDRDAEQLTSLNSWPLVREDPRCHLFCGENAEFLRLFPSTIHIKREWQLGSIFSDPNGADVPIDEIAEICKIFPRIDVIFHWNSTITKRLRYGIKPEQITLDAIPRTLSKKHWLIREPIGPHQFAILIGRNFRGHDWPKGGFFHLDSSEGEEIMDRCSRSIKDRQHKDKEI